MRILIVEDDVPLSRLLREGLEAEHYAVEVSHRGDDAFTKVGMTEYDLVILDLTLPGMEGGRA